VAKKSTRKTRVKEADDAGELEVEEVVTEEVQPAKRPASLEAALIGVTTFALVWGFALLYMKLVQVSGKGWPV
jgi:hypothetical protein